MNSDSVKVKECVGNYTILSEPYIWMECRALYSQHSKINHSCKPNVMLNYIENSAKLEIIATRKIQINEEIGMDYTAASFSSNVSKISDADERKKILKGLGLKETSNSLLFRIQFEL